MKKPGIPLVALLLYVSGLCCFILPVVFPALQFDGGFGYMFVLYYLCGIIFLLAGFIFHSWVKSGNAAAHARLLEGIEKDTVSHRLGEGQERGQQD
ncbi:hypothetical protein ACO0LL_29080 [Undibacterium sp. TC4M20W]|uniref:hypothetical protein n=1 Tax=Undibacterium sp. TC4M20W TaxID=3413052 RepID=UPI003BF23C81